MKINWKDICCITASNFERALDYERARPELSQSMGWVEFFGSFLGWVGFGSVTLWWVDGWNDCVLLFFSKKFYQNYYVWKTFHWWFVTIRIPKKPLNACNNFRLRITKNSTSAQSRTLCLKKTRHQTLAHNFPKF